MFALIPYDVWAVAHHVGLAVVVAIMFGFCAYIVVETISDAVG